MLRTFRVFDGGIIYELTGGGKSADFEVVPRGDAESSYMQCCVEASQVNYRTF